MLRDEHGMSAIGRLPTVVQRLGRGQSLHDDLTRMLLHRVGATNERNRPIAAAGREMKLRAKALSANRVELRVEIHREKLARFDVRASLLR